MTLLPPSLASSRILRRKNRVMKTVLDGVLQLLHPIIARGLGKPSVGKKPIHLSEPIVPRRLWKSVVKDMQFLEAAF